MTRKTKTQSTKIPTNPMVSTSTVSAEALRHAALEQADADLGLLQATVELTTATITHKRAIERKSKAEVRLAKLRNDLHVTFTE